MKTEIIKVTSRGDGMEEALSVTEALGEDSGLARREKLRLRLLAEELIGLMRGITGDVEAYFWGERNNWDFVLHLKADVTMNQELRRQLLAASSSGKNAAARGFMGKLREMVAVVLLPGDPESAMLSGMSLGLMSMGSPIGYTAGIETYAWTMSRYMSEIRSNLAQGGEAAEAWDELEKSIVANLADEVSVRIVGRTVEIAISKTF